MLKLYSKAHVFLGNINEYKNLKIESQISDGDKTLSFTYLGQTILQNEMYIRTDEDEYVIKEVPATTGSFPSIVCALNLEDLQKDMYQSFILNDTTIQAAAEKALEGTGWTIGTCDVTKTRNAGMVQVSTLKVIQNLATAFMCEVEFDTLNKKVSFYQQRGEDKGVYFITGLNLKKLQRKSTSYDYYTRLIPIGENGLTIESVNDGKNYLENFQYSDKVLTYLWKDESYTNATALKEDAELKLDDLSKPEKSYSVEVRNLAAMSEEYSILDYDLGDTIRLIDAETGTMELQRIKKLTRYPEEPDKDSCEIANTMLTFEEMQEKYNNAANIINYTVNGDGRYTGTISVSDILNLDKGVAATESVTKLTEDVETKVSKDKVILSINQSEESLTIQANKIKLEGAVTQSGGFSIDENGNMTATNGTFAGVVNATSGSFNGKLTAESGTIGGWTIGKSALYKNTKTLTDTTTGTYIGTDGIINRNSSYVQIKDGKLTASTQEGARAVIGSMINEEWPIKVYSGENSSMSAAIGYDGLVYAQGVSDMGNLSVGGNATIDGKATIGGHVFLNNSKDIFCQLSDGTNIDVMHMSTTDHLVIGGGLRTNTEASFSNIYLDTQGDIIFRIGDSTESTNLRVYREYGDSITISGIALTGYISNSSKSAYFTIPVDRPTIDSSCAVTVEGVTLRQGGKYLYGSSASKDVVPSSISAYVRGGNIYVAMTFSNTTNVINNETVGIYLTNVVIKYT